VTARLTPELAPAGDSGLYVRFGAASEAVTVDVMLAVMAALDADRPPGVLDILPGYATVLVTLDPGRADRAVVEDWIERTLGGAQRSHPPAGPAPARRTVDIPVLYDPAVAPDLEPLAHDKGLAIDELVALHTAGAYRCALLGFRPGFPFLAGLDPRLWAPRLATPRVRVPAGSVAIGGRQTGVYPVDSPGGWRIIGRTPVRLFDPGRADPFLVRAGDDVRFVRIDDAELARFDGQSKRPDPVELARRPP